MTYSRENPVHEPLLFARIAPSHMDKIDRYVDRVQRLAPAPRVVAQLKLLFADPNREVDRLAELISYDPSLTVEMFRRSNSAFFRGSEPAADVFEAVTRLGFHEAQSVANSLVVSAAASMTGPKDAGDADHLWRHSVATAVAAGALAAQIHESEVTAFTVGLLHDIGMVVLAAFEGAPYAELMRKIQASGAALVHAEQARLGVTHPEIGSRLLVRWGLPVNIISAVLHHHHPSPAAAAPFERLAATLQVADNLAHQVTGGETPAPDPASSNPEAMTLLELSAADLREAGEQVRERLRKVEELLQVPPW